MAVYIHSMRFANDLVSPPPSSAIPAATLVFVPRASAEQLLRGRGTAWAIEHRFSGQARSDFDDGWGTAAASRAG